MNRLKKRSEFLAVARGARLARRGFVLQALTVRASADQATPAPWRCGFTVTKKIGNAAVRNRIRRRLKEAVRLIPDGVPEAGVDYVLVGREEALRLPFASLRADLAGAFQQSGARLKQVAASPGAVSSRSGSSRLGPGRPDARSG